MSVRLIVCDWEGCVTEPGGGKVTWPTPEVAALSDLINQMRAKGYPPLVLCSGRQFPYGEAALQAINAFWDVPSILESGVGLYYPKAKAVEWHPLIASIDEGKMGKIKRIVGDVVKSKEGRQRELGKEYCISINPAPGETIDELKDKLRKKLQQFLSKVKLSHSREEGEVVVEPDPDNPGAKGLRVADLKEKIDRVAKRLEISVKIEVGDNRLVLQTAETALLRYSLLEHLFHKMDAEEFHDLFGHIEITWSGSAVDITPSGVNKGSGVLFLEKKTGVKLEEMVGIGDSSGDLPMLELVGFPAAPANADECVCGLADYCSAYRTTRGVMDIIEHYCAGVEVHTEARWRVSVRRTGLPD